MQHTTGIFEASNDREACVLAHTHTVITIPNVYTFSRGFLEGRGFKKVIDSCSWASTVVEEDGLSS